MSTFTQLMSDIESTYKEGGEWCSLEKAQALAAIVVGLRPRTICEIGVWMGGSLVPMVMALGALRSAEETRHGIATRRKAFAVDAWSKEASCVGQADSDVDWWSSVDHEEALRTFRARLERHEISDLCQVVRARSDQAIVPTVIDLLHVDGNHAEQAARDVDRFARTVPVGGILVLDDLNWSGGHVRRAHQVAVDLGFRDLYPLGEGVVMQRFSSP